ncbi:MAG: 5-(carboxyamino)imidazole ribonucleotide mutase [Pelagibacterales bacterium]|nr:5-(carboxyamino)imidazole ribonucleotide mutase [Pelagibacterales bacterium]|tara:strand:+ start:2154 stop:2627 length:474 start_codon:yes stop_codon:yes gene_type:complete
MVVSIVMGSQSDWDTMKQASEVLELFKIVHETKIISAHRTPERLYSFSKGAEKKKIKIIIAGAGGAAHLPGMISSMSNLPVLGVPIESRFMDGLDSLLSIVQMPFGVPTATFAVGKAGAKNAALFAVGMLSINNRLLSKKLNEWRRVQTESVKLRPI